MEPARKALEGPARFVAECCRAGAIPSMPARAGLLERCPDEWMGPGRQHVRYW